jgi:hypothetical protein
MSGKKKEEYEMPYNSKIKNNKYRRKKRRIERWRLKQGHKYSKSVFLVSQGQKVDRTVYKRNFVI